MQINIWAVDYFGERHEATMGLKDFIKYKLGRAIPPIGFTAFYLRK